MAGQLAARSSSCFLSSAERTVDPRWKAMETVFFSAYLSRPFTVPSIWSTLAGRLSGDGVGLLRLLSGSSCYLVSRVGSGLGLVDAGRCAGVDILDVPVRSWRLLRPARSVRREPAQDACLPTSCGQKGSYDPRTPPSAARSICREHFECRGRAASPKARGCWFRLPAAAQRPKHITQMPAQKPRLGQEIKSGIHFW